MRICVIGAGAIGGYLAVKLALAGEEVTVVARGRNLDAIRENGISLLMANAEQYRTDNIRATQSFTEAGLQDVVILCMKAHQVAEVAPDISVMFHPDTIVVTTQNGIPWWYFLRHGGVFEGRSVESVDPGGVIASHIPANRIIGCVVYPATELIAPGVIRHIEGERFPVGEIDGYCTERVKMISRVFERAGFKAPVLENVRAEIWLKLWGNLTFNPISALTHGTLMDICQFQLTRELAVAMMSEAQSVANKLGIEFRVSLEKRIAGAEKVGKHKTSMLQDVEAGRALEIDALVGSVVELGRLTATPTPHIDAVYACTKLLAKLMSERQVQIKPIPYS